MYEQMELASLAARDWLATDAGQASTLAAQVFAYLVATVFAAVKVAWPVVRGTTRAAWWVVRAPFRKSPPSPLLAALLEATADPDAMVEAQPQWSSKVLAAGRAAFRWGAPGTVLAAAVGKEDALPLLTDKERAALNAAVGKAIARVEARDRQARREEALARLTGDLTPAGAVCTHEASVLKVGGKEYQVRVKSDKKGA